MEIKNTDCNSLSVYDIIFQKGQSVPELPLMYTFVDRGACCTTFVYFSSKSVNKVIPFLGTCWTYNNKLL